MALLILGLIVFFVLHLIPCAPGVKGQVVERLTTNGYMAAFSLLSLVGVVLIVMGLKSADFVELYQPPAAGRGIALVLMLPAIYLFFSNSVGPAPSSAQKWTAHPMNWGVIVWSIAHLLANGDLAHVLLFASFGIYSVVSMLSANARGAKPKRERRPPLAHEAGFLVVVVVLYAVIMWAHVHFTGMALI